MRINGAALRIIRERSGLNITEASARVGVRQPTWSNWERGARNATPSNVRLICEALAIDDMTAILVAEPEPVRS